jgi:hypothetical protein
MAAQESATTSHMKIRKVIRALLAGPALLHVFVTSLHDDSKRRLFPNAKCEVSRLVQADCVGWI